MASAVAAGSAVASAVAVGSAVGSAVAAAVSAGVAVEVAVSGVALTGCFSQPTARQRASPRAAVRNFMVVSFARLGVVTHMKPQR